MSDKLIMVVTSLSVTSTLKKVIEKECEIKKIKKEDVVVFFLTDEINKLNKKEKINLFKSFPYLSITFLSDKTRETTKPLSLFEALVYSDLDVESLVYVESMTRLVVGSIKVLCLSEVESIERTIDETDNKFDVVLSTHLPTSVVKKMNHFLGLNLKIGEGEIKAEEIFKSNELSGAFFISTSKDITHQLIFNSSAFIYQEKSFFLLNDLLKRK